MKETFYVELRLKYLNLLEVYIMDIKLSFALKDGILVHISEISEAD